MYEVTEIEIKKRLTFDNPWWGEAGGIDSETAGWQKRAYFHAFCELAIDTDVHRAVVLMGPRRVGKTVMIRQTVQHLIDRGVSPSRILYVSVDTPTYIGVPLEGLLRLFCEHFLHGRESKLYVFFDEIQYLKDWEVHLKSLVDSYPKIRFVASGSAAAALRLRSRESGAGRFTDFLLPPLTFAEFLSFTGWDKDQIPSGSGEFKGSLESAIAKLNSAFIDYLNFGGFPEAVLTSDIRRNFQRFVGSDILDKVLLRDLPSIYGISDTRELNRVFTLIAYNTGDEFSLEGLSKSSGIAKNTLKKFFEYLEAAFLIERVYRIDHNAKRLKRATTFKIYLTNPCLRAALFGSVEDDDEAMGRLAETAVYSQLFHTFYFGRTFYARWRTGEIDLIIMDRAKQHPISACEVKWSNRIVTHLEELGPFLSFCEKNDIDENENRILTKSYWGTKVLRDHSIVFVPVSLFCYWIGERTIQPLLESGKHPHIYDPIPA